MPVAFEPPAPVKASSSSSRWRWPRALRWSGRFIVTVVTAAVVLDGDALVSVVLVVPIGPVSRRTESGRLHAERPAPGAGRSMSDGVHGTPWAGVSP